MLQTKIKNKNILSLALIFANLIFATPITTLYFLDKGLILEHIVTSQIVYSLVNLILEFPTGVIGDKIGHKLTIIAGLFCNFLFFASFLIFPSLLGLMLGVLFSAVGDALISGSNEAYLYSSDHKNQYLKNWTKILSFSNISLVFATFVGSLIYGHIGQNAYVPLLIMTVIIKLASVILSLLLTGQKSASSSSITTISSQSLSFIISNPIVKKLTLTKFLTLTGEYVIYAVYAPHLLALGVTPLTVGLLLSFGLLLNGLNLYYSKWLNDKIRLPNMFLVIGITTSVSLLSLSQAKSASVATASFLILVSQFNLLDPVISNLINHQTSPSQKSSVLSGISFLRSLANLGLKFVLLFIISLWNVQAMYMVLSVYIFVGSVVSYFLTSDIN